MSFRSFPEKRHFSTVRDLVEWAGEAYAERNAYSHRRKLSDVPTVISFARFRSDVRALTSALIRRGCQGKHCVLVGKFSYDWVLTYFSVLSCGGVLVPLDREWQGSDLAKTAKAADMAFLFCDEEIRDKGEEMTSEGGIPVTYLCAKAEETALQKLLEEGEALYAAHPEAYHQAPIDPLGLSLLVFTSGTTGKGKGVMLSQNAVLTDMSDVIPSIRFGEKTVGVLPPHHTYGSTIMLIGHAMIGCEIYISMGLRYVQKEFKEQQPEHLILVPLYLETLYRKIQSNIAELGKTKLVARMMKISDGLQKIGIDLRKKFFSSIRAALGGKLEMVITGGAPISQEVVDFFHHIGVEVLNGYGITECAPLIAVNRTGKTVRGSVGQVIDQDEVIIDDPNEAGEGEILVKGPNVMLGYYKDPLATEEAFTEGYFRTGDYGKFGKDNALIITGRKKNLIILSNGKNVYPEEIETALSATPGLLDVIVYEGQSKRGLAHNAIVAEIYPDYDYLEKQGISDAEAYFKEYIDAFNRTAVPYQKIGILRVRTTDFPKNTLRKIMRFQLDQSIE